VYVCVNIADKASRGFSVPTTAQELLLSTFIHTKEHISLSFGFSTKVNYIFSQNLIMHCPLPSRFRSRINYLLESLVKQEIKLSKTQLLQCPKSSFKIIQVCFKTNSSELPAVQMVPQK